MATIMLGNAGWVEAEDDGSFRMSLRGPMSKENAVRLGRWLLDRTGASSSPDEGSNSPLAR
jgi:hypothetical protein